MELTWTDRHYLARAYELARRGIGNVSPNPPVGAVIVRAGHETLGEGFHHRRGEPHAEVEAFRAAAARGYTSDDFRDATLYVSLEPCNHHGRTPPCSEAVVASGVRRVVIGTLDPNPRTALGGVRRLEAAGISVVLADDPTARTIIEPFTLAMLHNRPYVTLKMASSLDGRIAPRPGRHWLTGTEARRFVRDLRASHDVVLVGAGTARIDDPDLQARPPRTRRRESLRAVLCGATPLPADLKIFQPGQGRTLLLVPHQAETHYVTLRDHAEILVVDAEANGRINPHAALAALKEREIGSVLCEGGPTLAAAFLQAGVVDRLEWLIAPQLLSGDEAVPVLAGVVNHEQFRFEHIERLGSDLRLSIPLNRTSVI